MARNRNLKTAKISLPVLHTSGIWLGTRPGDALNVGQWLQAALSSQREGPALVYLKHWLDPKAVVMCFGGLNPHQGAPSQLTYAAKCVVPRAANRCGRTLLGPARASGHQIPLSWHGAAYKKDAIHILATKGFTCFTLECLCLWTGQHQGVKRMPSVAAFCMRTASSRCQGL